MKKIVGFLGVLVFLISCAPAPNQPQPTDTLKVHRITQMTLIGDTLIDITVPEDKVGMVNTDGSAIRFEYQGQIRTLNGGILNHSTQVVKVDSTLTL